MKKLLFAFFFLVGLSAMSFAQTTTTATEQEPAKTTQEHKGQKACCKKGDAKAASCSEHKNAKATKACCKKDGQASASTTATPAADEQAEKPCTDSSKACCKKGKSAKASCQKSCCKSAKAEPAAAPAPAN